MRCRSPGSIRRRLGERCGRRGDRNSAVDEAVECQARLLRPFDFGLGFQMRFSAAASSAAAMSGILAGRRVMFVQPFRPQAPLVVVANSMRLYRSLALVRGVSPLLAIASGTGGTGLQACLVQAREWLISHGLAEPDDQVVLVFASRSACEQPDTLRTIRLSMDECTG